MIPKLLSQIDEDDLHNLLGSAESRQIEFKLILPGGSDQEIKEFLKDVSAMANTEGGDIIYGIAEGLDDEGNTVAKTLEGIQEIDSDEGILRLTNILLDGLKPRLAGFQIRSIPLKDSKKAFVVRVSKSWNSPHVVDRKGHWRFYCRNDAGTYPIDITELRNAFLFSDNISQRLEEFRISRLAKVASNPLFTRISKAVVHYQPLSSAQRDANIELARVRIEPKKLSLIPFYYDDDYFDTGQKVRLNFDGILSNATHGDEAGHIQVFRTGAIEVVDTHYLNDDETPKEIQIRSFEYDLIHSAVRSLALLRELGIATPTVFHLALLGVKDFRIRIETPTNQVNLHFLFTASREYGIAENDLLFPGVLFSEELLTDFDDLPISYKDPRYDQAFKRVSSVLQPVFDILWNSCGMQRSRYYNSDGIWTGNIEPDY